MTSRNAAASSAPISDKRMLRKLKPGPGLSREEVALDQRLRLQMALSDLAADSGYDTVTVRALIRRARVSTSTFYKLHEGVEECFAGAVGNAIRSLAEEIGGSRRLDGDLRSGLHAGLRRLMERLAREPRTARMVTVESFAAGRRVHDEMESALGEFETLLAATLGSAARPAAGTTHLAIGLVAGVVRVIRRTTLTARVEDLPGVAAEIADWILALAHEEIVAFRAPRERSTDGDGGRRLGVVPPSREVMADSGRRATMATARLAASAGLVGLTGARIRKDAGLSRREFDRHFRGVEDCFLEAIEEISSSAAEVADSSAATAGSWERHVYEELGVLCELAAADQRLSRLVLIEITTPGRSGLLRREELISRCTAHLLAGAPAGKRPSELMIDASVAAVWRIAESEVAAGRAGALPGLAPVFVYMILAARRHQPINAAEPGRLAATAGPHGSSAP
jgi:AcrR family transcriptional regulator